MFSNKKWASLYASDIYHINILIPIGSMFNGRLFIKIIFFVGLLDGLVIVTVLLSLNDLDPLPSVQRGSIFTGSSFSQQLKMHSEMHLPGDRDTLVYLQEDQRCPVGRENW